MWNAVAAIRRPPLGQHTGISGVEAVRRIITLNAVAQQTGITRYVADHLAELAPALQMLDLRPPE